jgi:hypothetical protein
MTKLKVHVTIDYPPGETAIWSGNNVAGNVHISANKDAQVVSVTANVQTLIKTKVLPCSPKSGPLPSANIVYIAVGHGQRQQH